MSRAPRLFGLILLEILAISSLEARTVRIATFNIQNGPDPAGTADYEATKAVLARIDADVVGFQELLLSNEAAWRQMAQELGYGHVEIGRDGTTMSGNQRLGYFSRFPIAEVSLVRSPPGANEISRLPMRVAVEVPGAAQPLVLWNMHHKADDTTSANTPGNQFRRAIEAYRIVQDINAYRTANPEHDEFVMLGDLNDNVFQASAQAVQFDTIPSLTSGSFQLGADIPWPVAYRAFPDDRYAAAGGGLHRLDVRQQDSSSRATRPVSGRTLDYLLVSTALRDSPLGAPRGEVYHSQWDGLYPGLPKAGAGLTSGTSLAASDHLAVFADIEMDDAVPINVVVSPAEEVEFSGLSGGPFAPAVASYTITNPTLQPVEVMVSADVPWLVPDLAGGAAAALGQIGLEVSIDAGAAPTRPGDYVGRIRITETATGAAVLRSVRLRVLSRVTDYFARQFSAAAPFDLAFKSVTFTPDGSPNFYRASIRSAAALPVDPAGGTLLALELDDSRLVQLSMGKTISLYGVSYGQFFVGSHGYLTFTRADIDWTPTLGDHYTIPRISGLFADIDPRSGGVLYKQLPDRVAVSYINLPVTFAGGSNNFQIEMFFDGRIRLTWLQVDVTAPIVGLSSGEGLVPGAGGSEFGVYPSTDGVPLAFEDFVRGYGLDPLGGGAPTADPDGDSFSNEQEYAFGRSPIAGEGSLLTASSAGGGLTVTWLQHADVAYAVQSTTNLATTAFVDDSTLDVEAGPAEPAPPVGYTRKEFTVTATGATFYRVSASEK